MIVEEDPRGIHPEEWERTLACSVKQQKALLDVNGTKGQGGACQQASMTPAGPHLPIASCSASVPLNPPASLKQRYTADCCTPLVTAQRQCCIAAVHGRWCITALLDSDPWPWYMCLAKGHGRAWPQWGLEIRMMAVQCRAVRGLKSTANGRHLAINSRSSFGRSCDLLQREFGIRMRCFKARMGQRQRVRHTEAFTFPSGGWDTENAGMTVETRLPWMVSWNCSCKEGGGGGGAG